MSRCSSRLKAVTTATFVTDSAAEDTDERIQALGPRDRKQRNQAAGEDVDRRARGCRGS